MATYKIKKYFTEKIFKDSVVIKAMVFKYRFGFLVDIFNETLDSKYTCVHENLGRTRRCRPIFRQKPITKKNAKTIINVLNAKK